MALACLLARRSVAKRSGVKCLPFLFFSAEWRAVSNALRSEAVTLGRNREQFNKQDTRPTKKKTVSEDKPKRTTTTTDEMGSSK